MSSVLRHLAALFKRRLRAASRRVCWINTTNRLRRTATSVPLSGVATCYPVSSRPARMLRTRGMKAIDLYLLVGCQPLCDAEWEDQLDHWMIWSAKPTLSTSTCTQAKAQLLLVYSEAFFVILPKVLFRHRTDLRLRSRKAATCACAGSSLKWTKGTNALV